jgi:hypothetical protein
MRRITYQTLSGLMADNLKLMELLSNLDRAVMLRPNFSPDLRFFGSDLARAAFVKVLKSLTSAEQSSNAIHLESVLGELQGGSLERLSLLRLLARRLSGSLVPVGPAEGRWSDLFRSPRGAVQRWSLERLSLSSLTAIANRLARR